MAAHSFGEEHSTTDLAETVLRMTPEKETLSPGEVIEMPRDSFEILKKDIFLQKSFFIFCLFAFSRAASRGTWRFPG